MQETKEHIKARMLKNAARSWGYPEAEPENNFDPLVSMLLSACAAELEKISADICASRARVLERMVQLISPDVLTGALPAHSIATALAADDTAEPDESMQFYCRIKPAAAVENDPSGQKDIFFSPTGSFHINKASIRYMAAGNKLFKTNSSGAKELLASSPLHLPAATLWLGIDEPALSLHNSLFYFDLHSAESRQLFYYQLPNALWYSGDVPLSHLPGYGGKNSCDESFCVADALSSFYTVGRKIKKHINGFYKAHFITLLDEQAATGRHEHPGADDPIGRVFSGKESAQLSQASIRWINIRFPAVVPDRLLQDVVCVVNCFPVMNSRLHEIIYRMQDLINIIPLSTDDIFFDLEGVYNEENQAVHVQDGQQEGGQPAATLLRNGGIGRFDERSATALIDHLLQLLHDESAAFHAMGNDFMNSEVKQLRQVINKLEQQRALTGHTRRDPAPYLVVRSHREQTWKHLYITYRSTHGQEANNIKAGTCLQLYKGASVKNSQAILVQATQGGRDKLSTSESILAYKSALLSKDRLVTAEDIKAFCRYQLGDKIKGVLVSKGNMVHPDERQGYIKTIDVRIELHGKNGDVMEEAAQRFWENNLQVLLEQRSTIYMPYRVSIQPAS